MNLSTVRPVSKGFRGEPFDKLSPNGFVWRMLRLVASQDPQGARTAADARAALEAFVD